MPNVGRICLLDFLACRQPERSYFLSRVDCEYCQIATLCSFVSLVLAAPEVISAVRTLMGQPDESNQEFEDARQLAL